MTALETLLGNITSTATLGLETYITLRLIKDQEPKHQITTLALTASTVLDNIEVPDELLIVRDTISYVESLSDEELAKVDKLLYLREMDFEIAIELEESSKTFVKTDNHKQL